MLFLLIAGHALADFPLQPDAMATCKCRRARLPLQAEVPWFYWMTAHCLTHGFVTAIIVWFWSGDRSLAVLVGTLEFTIHWLIDYLKCEGVFGIHVDQALHVLCKVLWCVLLARGLLLAPTWLLWPG